MIQETMKVKVNEEMLDRVHKYNIMSKYSYKS